MYTGFLHLHNLLRYVVVILLVIAVVKSFAGWFGKKSFTKGDDKVSLFLLIFSHVQLLLGLALYFMSPVVETALNDFGTAMRDEVLRFWGVEHILSMVIAIAIITVGRIMGKKAKDEVARHRRQAIYFLLALVLIFASIPWPWSTISRPWF